MFASRNLEAARTVYGEMPVKLVQAPRHQRQPSDMFKPNSYVDVLINQGFEESDLKSRVLAWSDLFETWRPAVVIAEVEMDFPCRQFSGRFPLSIRNLPSPGRT